MAKTDEISIETRWQIISLHKIGRSNRAIAKQFKIPSQTVDYIVRKFKGGGTILNKTRNGRPRATSKHEDHLMIITSKRNRHLTAPEIAAHVNSSRPNPVSVSTVKRRLVTAGLNGRIALKNPLLGPQNKRRRL